MLTLPLESWKGLSAADPPVTATSSVMEYLGLHDGTWRSLRMASASTCMTRRFGHDSNSRGIQVSTTGVMLEAFVSVTVLVVVRVVVVFGGSVVVERVEVRLVVIVLVVVFPK
mmetsp:Transcript_19883/g.35502  ORF Transcript_19883/g.35502 Transcript_19883/m.35502 type:complete len:113 (+) Transcript_19883:219-557(+)